MIPSDEQQARCVDLLRLLQHQSYDFVPATPRTHGIVLHRKGRDPVGTTTADILGWSLPFEPANIDQALLIALREADVLETIGERQRSTVRVARLGDDLFLHSAYPTTNRAAVFFGPDTYRFADLIRAQLQAQGDLTGTLVDIGTGSGVGAIVAARCLPGVRVLGTDINAEALGFARVNAAAAGLNIDFVEADVLGELTDPIDLALANPPYIVDAEGRAYRNGGGLYGAELSVRMIDEVLPRLNARGMFILYTGAPVVNGRDPLRERAEALSHEHGCSLTTRMIDPDVFGEELESPAYANVDRIAAVGLVFRKR